MPPDLDDDRTGIHSDPFRALTLKILLAAAVPLCATAVGMYIQSELHAAELERVAADIAEHAAAPVHMEAERGVAQLRGQIDGLQALIEANERVNQAKLEGIAERLGRIESSVTRRRRTGNGN